MATYTVSAGHRALGKWMLTAGSADTVAFEDDVSNVQVHNFGSSTSDVWLTTDGTTPTVPAAHVSTAALCLPPGGVLDLDLRRDNDALQLVSDGAATVLVQVRDN